jgi:hypothetical protein
MNEYDIGAIYDRDAYHAHYMHGGNILGDLYARLEFGASVTESSENERQFTCTLRTSYSQNEVEGIMSEITENLQATCNVVPVKGVSERSDAGGNEVDGFRKKIQGPNFRGGAGGFFSLN